MSKNMTKTTIESHRNFFDETLLVNERTKKNRKMLKDTINIFVLHTQMW